MHPLIWRIINNVAILVIAMVIISFAQRGFFWRFIRVKISFGKFVLCKIRAINRDYFRVGHISEGFLIYKHDKKNDKRISVDDNDVFYRCLGVAWVEVNEKENSLAKNNYSAIPGFDAIKYSDLYKRALYKPTISDDVMTFRIIMIMVGIAIIGVGIVLFIVFNMYDQIGLIQSQVSSLQTPTVIQPSGL